MLGKNAGGLFWMFRYIERAENIARLLEAGWHIALTRSNGGANEWQSILTTAGINAAYREKYSEYDAATVINFLLRDRSNPSCVMSAIEAARTNARQVRTALSGEVWEAVNDCWMTLKSTLARPVTERNLYDTLSTIRHGTSVVRGALHGTMLRNDIYAFSRLGTFIERADNTARILDVKYYVLLPSAAFVGTTIDNAQWEVILRSVSAERSYHWLNGGDVSPYGIAEFLILDRRMPRSLAFCYSKIGQYLELLEQEYGQRQDSQIQSDRICMRLRGASVPSIFEDGLHEFLRDFIADTSRLANHIETDFRFYR
ncbi:alpha-E domain-containing protein [Antarcticimicrobium luteum]|nr:alpha-E domain-containing protein [Antarcticimicrobium luteum]